MSEAIYCFDTATVRFVVYSEGCRCIAEIREDPLRDLFGACGGGDSLLQAYLCNAEAIDARALQRLHHAPGAEVVLETADFEPSHDFA